MEDNGLLRPVEPGDLDILLKWRNHPSVRNYMYSQHEISDTEHKAWFKRVSQQTNRHLLLFEDEHITSGFVQFHIADYGTTADWGFYISPVATKGTGTRLGQAALLHAYTTLNLHKVAGQALAFNTSSIHLHKKLGFQNEGVLRQHFFDGINHHDIFQFGLLASEWSSR